MFQTQTAILDFKKMSYDNKLKKIKEALELVKNKSSQFQDLHALCNLSPQPMESIIDMAYETIMQTVQSNEEKNYQDSIVVMKVKKKKLEEQYQKEKQEALGAEDLLGKI